MIFLPTLGTVTSFEPRQGDSVPHGLAEQKKKKTAPEMLQCTVGHTIYRKG